VTSPPVRRLGRHRRDVPAPSVVLMGCRQVLLQPSETACHRNALDVDDEGGEPVGLGQPSHQGLAAGVLPPGHGGIVTHRPEHVRAQLDERVGVLRVRAP
jgi:hypothetical protein